MPKIKASTSKRMTSRQRHKIERKKREHKRDLRKAAKALKKSGLGPSRSKKSREMAKIALKVSNSHPHKEDILNRVVQVRENARVLKASRRARRLEEAEEVSDNTPHVTTPRDNSTRQLLYIPVRDSHNFRVQFTRSLEELVFPVDQESTSSLEIPSVAYLVTLDARFAVQAIPWTLLDAIVDQSKICNGDRKVLLLFVLTKIDLVSASAIVSQISLVAVALHERYGNAGFGKSIIAAITPFSVYHDETVRRLQRILHQFQQSEGCSCKKSRTNLDKKVCAFVIGLPNTGRRTLCRTVACEANETSVSAVPLRAAQIQLIKGARLLDGEESEHQVRVKFALPNAKAICLVSFPEDAGVRRELRNVSGSDIMFCSLARIERLPEPEALGCVLYDSVVDKIHLAQAFCQPAEVMNATDEAASLKAAERFLRKLGQTVRREKAFHVSPLFVSTAGTMGKTSSSSLTAHVGFTSGQQSSQATLLDASYSNATPSRMVRISSVVTPSGGGRKSNRVVRRADTQNALRLGARTLVRELCQGKNVPWAVMRAPGMRVLKPAQVAKASEMFSLSLSSGKKMDPSAELRGSAQLEALLQSVSALLKCVLVFLPNGVVEMHPDSVAAPQYMLEEETCEDEEEGLKAEELEEESEGEEADEE